MAVFRWRGNGAGTKSDFQDGRNWVDDADAAYAQARYPGSDAGVYDEVYFDQALGAGCLGATTACDNSAKVDLKSLKVSPLYDGGIGLAGGYLIVDITNNGTAAGCECIIDQSAAQDIYIKADNGGITDLKIIGSQAGKAVYLDCDAGCTMANVTLLKANVVFGTNTDIATSLTIGYITNIDSDVIVNSAANPIASTCSLPAITMTGGVVYSATALGTLRISGGTIHQAGNITALNQTGGTVYWTSGTLSAADVHGGTLSLATSTIARTVTQAQVYPGGTINLDNGVRNITVTNWLQVFGGTVSFCEGQKITLTA
jgi:hypothetical protein